LAGGRGIIGVSGQPYGTTLGRPPGCGCARSAPTWFGARLLVPAAQVFDGEGVMVDEIRDRLSYLDGFAAFVKGTAPRRSGGNPPRQPQPA
jgi:hypothetical protein